MNYRLAGQEALGKQWRYQKEIVRLVETVRCLILEYWKNNDKVRSDARGDKEMEIHYVKEGRR